MSYKYYFFDDQTVGAEDLNKLVTMFATDGVADVFENGTPYNISKFADVVHANASDGIVPKTTETLKVSYDLGFVYIEPGVAFFKDGTVIEIETQEQIPAPEETEFYVYLESDPLKNMAYPMVSPTLPEGNIVPLAKVSETGEITDLRRFARGKVPSFYASNAGVYVNANDISITSSCLEPGKRITIVPAGNAYRYIVLICRHEYPYEDRTNYWSTTLVYDTQTNVHYNFSKPMSNSISASYTAYGIGTHFRVLDCYYNTYRYILHGNLHFDDGKAELEITKEPTSMRESTFNSYAFPIKMTIIAC